MSALVDVGAVDDFREHGVSIVEAERHEVGIIRWNGRFFAVRNICPHIGAPLCEGMLVPHLREHRGEPWSLEIDDEGVTIVCPWHRWEFDVTTGRALVGHLRVKTYPVVVRDNRVLLEIGRSTPSA